MTFILIAVSKALNKYKYLWCRLKKMIILKESWWEYLELTYSTRIVMFTFNYYLKNQQYCCLFDVSTMTSLKRLAKRFRKCYLYTLLTSIWKWSHVNISNKCTEHLQTMSMSEQRLIVTCWWWGLKVVGGNY